jgi:hypothetical protein
MTAMFMKYTLKVKHLSSSQLPTVLPLPGTCRPTYCLKRWSGTGCIDIELFSLSGTIDWTIQQVSRPTQTTTDAAANGSVPFSRTFDLLTLDLEGNCNHDNNYRLVWRGNISLGHFTTITSTAWFFGPKPPSYTIALQNCVSRWTCTRKPTQ